MNWQPIDTAPRDGTFVLIWDNEVSVAIWTRENKRPYWLRKGSFSIEANRRKTPTHWMPLPPPPTVNESLTVPTENPECESCQ